MDKTFEEKFEDAFGYKYKEEGEEKYFDKTKVFVKEIDDSERQDYQKNFRYEIELGFLYLHVLKNYDYGGWYDSIIGDELFKYSDIMDLVEDYPNFDDPYDDTIVHFVLSEYVVRPYHAAYDHLFLYKFLFLDSNLVQLFLNYHIRKYHSGREKNFVKFLNQEIMIHNSKNTEFKENFNELAKWLLVKAEEYNIYEVEDKNDKIETNIKTKIINRFLTCYINELVKGKKYLNAKSRDIQYITRKILYLNNNISEFKDKEGSFCWNGTIKELTYIFFLLSFDNGKGSVIGDEFDITSFITSTFTYKNDEINANSINKFLSGFKSFSNVDYPKNKIVHDNLLSKILKDSLQ